MNTLDLYDMAEKEQIFVESMNLSDIKSLIMRDTSTKRVMIALNPYEIKTQIEEKEVLGHELGHYQTNTYYNLSTSLETRGKKEYRANKWTVANLLPFCHLKAALDLGYTECWELSELFDLTPEFIQMAIDIYTKQNKLPIRNCPSS